MLLKLFTISFALSVCMLLLLGQVHGHGKLMKPPSRSSVWRIPEFAQYNPLPNYSDNELYCGAIHQADDPGTNCGVCKFDLPGF